MVGKINFAGVKTEFEPIPPGGYEAKFVDYKFTQVKSGANQGADAVNLQFAITEDAEPGGQSYKNRRVFRFCTFTPESLWAFKRAMVALGADVDWEGEVDPEAIVKSVKDAPCIVKLSIRENEVEDPITHLKSVQQQNNVDDIVPTESTRLAQMASAAAPVQEEEPARGRR